MSSSIPGGPRPLATVLRANWAAIALSQLLLATLLLRLLWLSQPPDQLIFDEVYYVNAARVILGWPLPAGATYADAPAGLDPNTEHLPLAKLIIAGSMRLLGDNAYGWRLPSVLFGTATVGLLYLLVRRVGRREDVALFAAFILSFDNLVFVHSRIATLDIFMLFFLLLGVYFYARARPTLAGAALALAALAKLNGIYGLGAIAAYEVLRFASQPQRRAALRAAGANLLLVFGSFLMVFLVVLWPLDRLWTGYTDPVDHLAHVYEYGVSLTAQEYPSSIESSPWQWLLNEVPIPYLRVNNTVTVDAKVVSSQSIVDFQGAMNPFVIAMLPLAVAYLLERALRTREALPLLMLALFAATYLPSFAMAVLAHRASYIFYFLPVLPALCTGIAYFLLDGRLSRAPALAYAATVVFGFLMMFPLHGT